MASNNSQKISDIIDNKIALQNQSSDFAREQITVLDDARTPYQSAVLRIDKSLFEDITDINNKLVDVQNAYNDRVSAGCRTDMFWVQTGFTTGSVSPPVSETYTYKCFKLSPVGYNTTSLNIVGLGTTSSLSTFGYQIDNLYGIKIYDEPYFDDIFSTYVGSSIGTVGAASTILYLWTPILSAGIALTVGQLVTSSKPLMFSGTSNKIVGVGTTMANISGIDTVGIGTTQSLINFVLLQNPTLLSASAPESDGSYVSFTILDDPANITDQYALDFGKSPYVQQTVKMMDSTTVGTGRSIAYDNSGNPNVTRQWNQFLLGFQNPDSSKGNLVQEPVVGAGKIYNTVGFTSAPAVYSGGSFDHYAVEGETITTTLEFGAPLSPIVNEVLSSCPTQETALTNKITIANNAKTSFASSLSAFQSKVELSNLIREDLGDLNIRIWGYRTQIGKAKENKSKYEAVKAQVNDPEFNDLING